MTLFVIAQQLHHKEHFFEGDEVAAVHELVTVNRVGQLMKGLAAERDLPSVGFASAAAIQSLHGRVEFEGTFGKSLSWNAAVDFGPGFARLRADPELTR